MAPSDEDNRDAAEFVRAASEVTGGATGAGIALLVGVYPVPWEVP